MDNPLATDRSFKQQAGDWLFQQGVSTVLLGFIAIGAWFGIPAAVREVKDTIVIVTTKIDEEKAAHKDEVKDLSSTFERTLDRLQGQPPKVAPPHLGAN